MQHIYDMMQVCQLCQSETTNCLGYKNVALIGLSYTYIFIYVPMRIILSQPLIFSVFAG